MEKQQGQSPKELPPRSGEKYRFAWKMEGDNGQSSYVLFQMGDCLYLTADTETLAENMETFSPTFIAIIFYLLRLCRKENRGGLWN